MPDHLGDDMRKVRPEEKEEEIKCKYWIVLCVRKSNKIASYRGQFF